MFDLLRAGNLYFTIPVTVFAILVVAVAVRAAVRLGRHERPVAERRLLFHLGLFTFVFGLLSQAIGLYQMMGVIQQAGDVSPALLAGGLQVSFIVPIYGLLVFAVALLARLGLDLAESRFDSRTAGEMKGAR